MTGTNTVLKVAYFTDPHSTCHFTVLQSCQKDAMHVDLTDLYKNPQECGPKIPVCPRPPTRKVTITEFKLKLWVKNLGHKFYFVFMKMPTLPPEGLSYVYAKILRKHLK